MNCLFCNEPVEPHFSFCEACGKPLTASPALPQAGVSEAPLARCLCGSTHFDKEGYCESCGHRATPQDAVDLQQIEELAASASHRGRHHAENQDAVLMQKLPDGLVIALADGVSTACHARAAADTAVQTAVQTLQDCAGGPAAERIADAVLRAHQAVCGLPHDDPQMAEPQATLVLALVQDHQLWYAWVGDSRLYVLNEAESSQLTRDDSWLNEQLSAGVAMASALKDANAHCITQCLGMRDDRPQVHVAASHLKPGDILLLCSDGLWNYCDKPEAMGKMIHGATDSLVQACHESVDFANRSGGQDNITIALYRHPQ